MPSQAQVQALKEAAAIPDDVLEATLTRLKHPNGPEDKILKEAGFTWDAIAEFAGNKPWTLSCKLAKCVHELGRLCEDLVERMAFYRLYHDRVSAALAAMTEEVGDAVENRMD